MKVIKAADWSDWHYSFICVQCKSELEADASDLVWQPGHDDWRESWPESFKVTCPVCGAWTRVSSEHPMPEMVKQGARKRGSKS